jgi:hypothetical protein
MDLAGLGWQNIGTEEVRGKYWKESSWSLEGKAVHTKDTKDFTKGTKKSPSYSSLASGRGQL